MKEIVLNIRALLGVVCGLSQNPVFAQSKADYTIFNPTPNNLMRDLATDRPDTTESPYTVDAGHFQVELSFLEYGRDDDGPDVDEFSVLPANLKAGLLNNMDIQLVLAPYSRVEVKKGSIRETLDGFGDTQVRLKINLWGNDGGSTALAVMPFVQVPTGSDDLSSDEVEGGIIVPFLMELPAGWSLTVMGEVDFIRNATDDGYETAFVHTASFARDLSEQVGAYIEYIGVASTDSTYAAGMGCGITYAVSPNVQLDGGVNIGFSEAAEDLRLFVGMSFRL